MSNLEVILTGSAWRDRVEIELCEAGIEIPDAEFKMIRISSRLIKRGKMKSSESAINGGFAFMDGWDGSYHDAVYNPYMVAWGINLITAKLWLGRAKERLEQLDGVNIDTTTTRMRARELVRKGD